MKLCERISEVTFVVGDHFYVRPGLLNQTEIPAPVRTSGMVMYLEQANSVSDIYRCAQKMQGNEEHFAKTIPILLRYL